MHATIDHIVIAVSNLKEAAQRVRALLGRDAVPGGLHEESGTQNLLVPLVDSYLELVTISDQEKAVSHPFGRLVASALAKDTLFAGWAAKYIPGQTNEESAVPLTRDGTTFHLRGLEKARLRPDVPFFIERHQKTLGAAEGVGLATGAIQTMLLAVPDHGQDWPLVEGGPTLIEMTSSSVVSGAIVEITLDDAQGQPVVLSKRTWKDVVLPTTVPVEGGNVRERRERMIGDRRHLHGIPEVGLQLPQTQAYLLKALEPLGLELSIGAGLSSIVAILRGKADTGKPAASRPAVLLRSDMDALSVNEATGLPFASTNGAMHACGHDLHMAILLEAVRTLAGRTDELPGDVVFAFQPGEENHGGAQLMITEGLYKRPDVQVVSSFGLHVLSYMLPTGVLALREGPIMAGSTIVSVDFRGNGGHGSAPHRTRDPLHAAAAFVPAVTAAIAHDIDMFEPTVLTFGSLHAGNSTNVIPDTAELLGTLRTFSEDNTSRARTIIERVAHAIADAHDVIADVKLTEICLPVHNHHAETTVAAQAAADAGLPLRWLDRPISVSEDFSYMLRANTGAFALLGAVVDDQDPTNSEANHSARADFSEDVLVPAADLMTAWAIRRLQRATQQHSDESSFATQTGRVGQ
ncbi:hypothetical protein NicSoilE8_41210 (plasmid) [Arthrobacter sp. NicSoilE8]|nr:hypothetical protein NicSoilE8_41210 [Arthrobacter sp. NicSoilE8]